MVVILEVFFQLSLSDEALLVYPIRLNGSLGIKVILLVWVSIGILCIGD